MEQEDGAVELGNNISEAVQGLSYGPLLWTPLPPACSMGPYLVYGIYLVCIWVQINMGPY